jgi:hypothetical protein
MKKISASFCLCLIFHVCFCQSPGLRIGPTLGLSQSMFAPLPGITQESKAALSGGLSFSDQLNRNVGFETEVLFSNRGSLIEGTKTDGTDLFGNPKNYTYTDNYRLLYTDIPLLLKLSLGIGSLHFKAIGGVSANFNMYSTVTRRYDDPDYNASNSYRIPLDHVQFFQLAAVYGLGFEAENAQNNIFSLDIRANNDLTPLGKVDGKLAYSNWFGIHFGFLFL